MVAALVYSLISVVIISAVSLAGVFTFVLKHNWLEKIIMILVSFAAGALIGGAFIHLVPEAVDEGGPVFPMIIIGIIVFFIMEIYLYWYHCHGGHIHKHKHGHECHIRPMGYLNLIGDAVHNVIDGMIVATAFLVDPKLGFVTVLAVIFHEIPQEIGDFGVLVYSGFSRYRALFFNFLTACTAIVGVLLTYAFASIVDNITMYLVPFAAGGFIYIAMTDLMGELKEEPDFQKATWQVLIFLAGIFFMWMTKVIAGV